MGVIDDFRGMKPKDKLNTIIKNSIFDTYSEEEIIECFNIYIKENGVLKSGDFKNVGGEAGSKAKLIYLNKFPASQTGTRLEADRKSFLTHLKKPEYWVSLDLSTDKMYFFDIQNLNNKQRIIGLSEFSELDDTTLTTGLRYFDELTFTGNSYSTFSNSTKASDRGATDGDKVGNLISKVDLRYQILITKTTTWIATANNPTLAGKNGYISNAFKEKVLAKITNAAVWEGLSDQDRKTYFLKCGDNTNRARITQTDIFNAFTDDVKKEYFDSLIKEKDKLVDFFEQISLENKIIFLQSDTYTKIDSDNTRKKYLSRLVASGWESLSQVYIKNNKNDFKKSDSYIYFDLKVKAKQIADIALMLNTEYFQNNSTYDAAKKEEIWTSLCGDNTKTSTTILNNFINLVMPVVALLNPTSQSLFLNSKFYKNLPNAQTAQPASNEYCKQNIIKLINVANYDKISPNDRVAYYAMTSGSNRATLFNNGTIALDTSDPENTYYIGKNLGSTSADTVSTFKFLKESLKMTYMGGSGFAKLTDDEKSECFVSFSSSKIEELWKDSNNTAFYNNRNLYIRGLTDGGKITFVQSNLFSDWAKENYSYLENTINAQSNDDDDDDNSISVLDGYKWYLYRDDTPYNIPISKIKNSDTDIANNGKPPYEVTTDDFTEDEQEGHSINGMTFKSGNEADMVLKCFDELHNANQSTFYDYFFFLLDQDLRYIMIQTKYFEKILSDSYAIKCLNLIPIDKNATDVVELSNWDNFSAINKIRYLSTDAFKSLDENLQQIYINSYPFKDLTADLALEYTKKPEFIQLSVKARQTMLSTNTKLSTAVSNFQSGGTDLTIQQYLQYLVANGKIAGLTNAYDSSKLFSIADPISQGFALDSKKTKLSKDARTSKSALGPGTENVKVANAIIVKCVNNAKKGYLYYDIADTPKINDAVITLLTSPDYGLNYIHGTYTTIDEETEEVILYHRFSWPKNASIVDNYNQIRYLDSKGNATFQKDYYNHKLSTIQAKSQTILNKNETSELRKIRIDILNAADEGRITIYEPEITPKNITELSIAGFTVTPLDADNTADITVLNQEGEYETQTVDTGYMISWGTTLVTDNDDANKRYLSAISANNQVELMKILTSISEAADSGLNSLQLEEISDTNILVLSNDYKFDVLRFPDYYEISWADSTKQGHIIETNKILDKITNCIIEGQTEYVTKILYGNEEYPVNENGVLQVVPVASNLRQSEIIENSINTIQALQSLGYIVYNVSEKYYDGILNRIDYGYDVLQTVDTETGTEGNNKKDSDVIDEEIGNISEEDLAEQGAISDKEPTYINNIDESSIYYKITWAEEAVKHIKNDVVPAVEDTIDIEEARGNFQLEWDQEDLTDLGARILRLNSNYVVTAGTTTNTKDKYIISWSGNINGTVYSSTAYKLYKASREQLVEDQVKSITAQIAQKAKNGESYFDIEEIYDESIEKLNSYPYFYRTERFPEYTRIYWDDTKEERLLTVLNKKIDQTKQEFKNYVIPKIALAIYNGNDLLIEKNNGSTEDLLKLKLTTVNGIAYNSNNKKQIAYKVTEEATNEENEEEPLTEKRIEIKISKDRRSDKKGWYILTYPLINFDNYIEIPKNIFTYPELVTPGYEKVDDHKDHADFNNNGGDPDAHDVFDMGLIHHLGMSGNYQVLDSDFINGFDPYKRPVNVEEGIKDIMLGEYISVETGSDYTDYDEEEEGTNETETTEEEVGVEITVDPAEASEEAGPGTSGDSGDDSDDEESEEASSTPATEYETDSTEPEIKVSNDAVDLTSTVEAASKSSFYVGWIKNFSTYVSDAVSSIAQEMYYEYTRALTKKVKAGGQLELQEPITIKYSKNLIASLASDIIISSLTNIYNFKVTEITGSDNIPYYEITWLYDGTDPTNPTEAELENIWYSVTYAMYVDKKEKYEDTAKYIRTLQEFRSDIPDFEVNILDPVTNRYEISWKPDPQNVSSINYVETMTNVMAEISNQIKKVRSDGEYSADKAFIYWLNGKTVKEVTTDEEEQNLLKDPSTSLAESTPATGNIYAGWVESSDLRLKFLKIILLQIHPFISVTPGLYYNYKTVTTTINEDGTTNTTENITSKFVAVTTIEPGVSYFYKISWNEEGVDPTTVYNGALFADDSIISKQSSSESSGEGSTGRYTRTESYNKAIQVRGLTAEKELNEIMNKIRKAYNAGEFYLDVTSIMDENITTLKENYNYEIEDFNTYIRISWPTETKYIPEPTPEENITYVGKITERES